MKRQVLGGRYRLGDVLGVGGMSTVWRAHDEVLDRDVAVKLLSGRYASDTAARQRIRVEARAAAALSHPNVAQVHDYGETVQDGQRTPFVVMELVPGPTLEERAAAAPLAPDAVFRICAEVAAGLAAAHADGLVHRDVKPANVIVAPSGAKVVDFGIAAASDPTGGYEEELLGTADYVAPERITDDAVTPASDVYSLGVLLYRLLAGRLPWAAAGATELIDAHLYTEPAPLPALRDVPRDVAAMCQRCLSKDPADRPTAAQVATVLAAAAGLGPRGGPAHAAPVSRRRGTRAVVGALGVTTAAVVGWALVPAPVAAPPAEAHGGAAVRLGDAVPEAGRPEGSGTSPTGAGQPSGSAAAPTTGTTTAPGPAQAGSATGTTPPAPTQPPSSGAASTPAVTAPPPPQEKTFTTAGGSVRAGCTPAGLARLLSWAPVSPYKVDWVNAGPAAAATVAFVHGNETIDVTVTCTGTEPVGTTGTHA